MDGVIPFYVPAGFRPKVKLRPPDRPGVVIEFRIDALEVCPDQQPVSQAGAQGKTRSFDKFSED